MSVPISSYSLAFFVAGVQALVFWVLQNLPGRIWFLVIFFVWMVAIVFLHFWLRRPHDDSNDLLWLALATWVSFVALAMLAEWSPMRYILVLLFALANGVMFFLPPGGPEFVSVNKSLRRIISMLWVLDIYALITSLFAIHQFIPQIAFWFLVLAMGALTAFGALMIWRMYVKLPPHVAMLWSLVVAFAVVEVGWVIHLLPYGYYASGLLVAWVWYIMQLFVRFHFDEKDIVWQKQRWFLLTNAILYIIILAFFIRWV